MTDDLHQTDRRSFLKGLSQSAVMTAAAPWVSSLVTVGEAAAFGATDYKALVCVFLNGGNDYGNTLVPYDFANYDLYSKIRGGGPGRTAGGIALGRDSLSATVLSANDGRLLTNNIQYALNPAMTGMKTLFDQGKMAVLLNVGPLVVPLTLAQYNSADKKTNPLPPKLFSHNDQQSVWQSGGSEGTVLGWGGLLGDAAYGNNNNAAFTCISAGGNVVYLAGNNVFQYRISTSGAVPIAGVKANVYGSSTCRDTLYNLITQTRTQRFEKEYNATTARSISAEGVVSSALSGATLSTSFNRDGQANSLADQLSVIARLIKARGAIGVKRQVFFVQLGGFDLHDFLIAQHPGLLSKVDEALSAFYAAMVEIGLENQVTAFTASDFGRTLGSNGDGSDHGWGSHHFIVGGAVQGGRFYGTAPQVSLTSSDQVGQGRLLPSTSVYQYSATLASWFGATSSEIASLFPNLAQFSPTNLGFMR